MVQRRRVRVEDAGVTIRVRGCVTLGQVGLGRCSHDVAAQLQSCAAPGSIGLMKERRRLSYGPSPPCVDGGASAVRHLVLALYCLVRCCYTGESRDCRASDARRVWVCQHSRCMRMAPTPTLQDAAAAGWWWAHRGRRPEVPVAAAACKQDRQRWRKEMKRRGLHCWLTSESRWGIKWREQGAGTTSAAGRFCHKDGGQRWEQ